jgi:hypothetical protein
MSAGAHLSQVSEVTLVPAKDNTLYEDAAGQKSNGSGDRLFVGNSNKQVIRRAVMEFDLAEKVPAGATILTATLTLNMSRTSSQGQQVSLHTVTAEWGEGGSDARQNEGSGAQAQEGDATWLHTFFPDQRWSNPGGDYTEAPSASTTVGAVGPYVWQSEQMAHDVQAWLDGPDDNHGWMLIGHERDGQSKLHRTSKRFNSREFESDVPSPKLVIQYSGGSPEPPTPTPVTPTAPPSDTPTPHPTVATPTPVTATPDVEVVGYLYLPLAWKN